MKEGIGPDPPYHNPQTDAENPEVWTKGDIFQRFGTTWDSLHYGLTQQPKAQASRYVSKGSTIVGRAFETWVKPETPQVL